MPFKPMKKTAFTAWIAEFGWSYKKGGTDYDLLDENGKRVCTINFLHGKAEIAPFYVEKTRKYLKERGKVK